MVLLHLCIFFTLHVNGIYSSVPDGSPQSVNADADFSNLIKKIWSLDKNRVTFGKDITLAFQGRVHWYLDGIDAASQNLFFNLNSNILKKPTYKAFIGLLNNYQRNTGIKETITNAQISENYNFLNLVLQTPIMREVYSFLKQKGKASPDYRKFKSVLYDLWFRPYYRSAGNRVQDSSGFEHVFVGEINTKGVSGFHSWLQLFLEEKAKTLNYMGYLKKPVNNPYIVMLRFKWYNQVKVIGSCFMGTSPEFDFALYTAAYLLGNDEVTFTLNGMNMKITCHGINRNRSIGTCYPDLL